MEQNNPEGMSFWDHLEELRWSLFRVIIALVVFMMASFIVMPHIFDSIILGPTTSDFFVYRWLSSLKGLGGMMPDFGNDTFHVDIININVASQFTTHIKTAFWLALVAAFPYLIYEIWRFIRPALFPHEKTNVRLAFMAGTLMFFMGCAVGYTVIFPFTFRFLTEYQLSAEITNQINLSSYIGNLVMMVLVMGIVFELPLVAWLLSKMGLVDKQMLKNYRNYAVVIMMVLSAFITPSGDPFTMMLVFVPLYLLYLISIRIVKDKESVEN